MRKEVGIALFLGSILGIVLALVITTSARTTETPSNPLPTNKNNPSSLTSKQVLAILTPEVNQAVGPTITVKGTTPLESEYLVIKTGNTQSLTKLDGSSFSADLSLTAGPSTLEFIAIKKDNSIDRLKRTFIVANAFDEGARHTFQGTITDIAEQTLQIRTSNGDIVQAVIKDNTTYKSYLKTPKDIKFSDMAIGDYVVTIGTVSDKGILTTKELQVINAQTAEADATVDVGVISDTSKKQIVVKAKEDEKTFEISSRTIRIVNPDGSIARGGSAALKKDLRIIVTDSTFFILPS